MGRVLFRLATYFMLAANLLTFGIFINLIAPYASYFFFNDWKFWNHLRMLNKFTVYSARYMWKIIRQEHKLIKTILPLDASPSLDHPDPTKFRISEDWNLPEDSCGDCNRCCTFVVECCFLDKSLNKCPCYGSIYWKYFNCGRFPSSSQLIEYFQCPKYEALD